MTVCLAACHPEHIQISATHSLPKQTQINEPTGRWEFTSFIFDYEAALGEQNVPGLWASIRSESEVWLCNFLVSDLSSLGLSSSICEMDCGEDQIKSMERVWHMAYVNKCLLTGWVGAVARWIKSLALAKQQTERTEVFIFTSEGSMYFLHWNDDTHPHQGRGPGFASSCAGCHSRYVV